MRPIKIDKLIRSKRRTISLEVLPDAALVVRAPKTAGLKFIEKVVEEKAHWIHKKQQEARKKGCKVIKRNFIDGEKFLYLGDFYSLKIIEQQQEPLKFEKEFFYLFKRYIDYATEVFTRWYQNAALTKISERTEFYANNTGLKFKKIRITNAKARWGSCNSRGYLNFSWRLIMAPLFVIDYIVVHELAHLKHSNHSKRFWNYVAKILPAYKKAKTWLDNNGHLLSI